MKRLFQFLLVLAVLQFIGHNASGQIILAWDFNGKAGGETTVEATTRDSLLSNLGGSAFITRGNGLNASNSANRFNATSWGTGSTLASAISDETYFQFDIAPVEGATMTFTSLTFDMKRSSTAPTTFTLLSSIDGFVDTAALKSWNLTGPTNNNNSIDLVTGLSGKFADLTSNVSFRLYGYNANSTAGSAGLGIAGNDLFLEGSVIPEPSTYALIFGGITLAIVLWHKRWKSVA